MFSGKNKCLSEIEVGAYIDGTLSPEKRDKVERHFVDCSKCWNEFIALQRVLTTKNQFDQEDAPEAVIRNVVNMFPQKEGLLDIVLKLAGGAVEVLKHSVDFSLMQPLPAAGIRSGKELSPGMVVLKRSFEEINVELNIEKMQDNLCSIRVLVDDPAAKEGKDIFRVELISRGRELFSSRIKQGEAVLEDVGTGLYKIKILKHSRSLGEISIKIK